PARRRNTGEKEQLLQEIYDVARIHGYRVRPGAARKAASASSSQAPQTADRGERRVATAVRDFASATLQAEPGEESTGFGDQVEPKLWSTTVFENVEVVTSAQEGPYEVVGDSSQSSVPGAATPQQQTPPSTAQVPAGGAGQAVGASAAAGAPRARRGRRRTADRHLELFERRLALEAETRERAAAQEDRPLRLEERRLALQERELQQRVREFEDAHEERRQERAKLLQQNQ
ncbi:hypothetical protein MTO96_043464, partial [Rhipicephalus appendiculatus]